MKIWKAIVMGVLLWMFIFVETSIFQIGFGLKDLTGNIIHYILLIPMSILCASLYYKSKGKLNGFILGLIFFVVMSILDIAVTIPVFTQGNYAGFYSNFELWIGIIESILVIGIYDKFRKK